MLNIIATKPSFNLHGCEFIPVNVSGLQNISIDTFLQELLQIANLDKNNEVGIDWTNMPLFNKQYLKEKNISVSTYRLLEMIYSALINKKDISIPYFSERMQTCP